MTEAPNRRLLLALHREAWSAVRGLLGDHGVVPPWSTRLLYGWRARLHSLAWRAQPRPPADAELPVNLFVAGFWRSGTTLLHECLARDGRWRTPTTQECMNPGQPVNGDQVVQRPMDRLTVAADSPQEDEFALLLLGAPSFYRVLLCPGAWRTQLEELAAGDAHATWPRREALLRELCAWLHGRDARPLLLKSPSHSFALARLLQIAPHSRTVIILRDWRAVWRSCLKMWSAMFELYALEPWTTDDVAALTQASLLEYSQALRRQLQRVDPARLAVIHYEDLAASPVATLAAVYGRFGWTLPDDFAESIDRFVAATRPTAPGLVEVPDALARAALAELGESHEALVAACRALRVMPAG
jgi:hypothetical protein